MIDDLRYERSCRCQGLHHVEAREQNGTCASYQSEEITIWKGCNKAASWAARHSEFCHSMAYASCSFRSRHLHCESIARAGKHDTPGLGP